MKVIEFKEYINNLEYYLTTKEEINVIVYANKDYVLNGVENSLNEEYCLENDVEILHTKHMGGTIVNFKEDICVGNFQNGFNDFGDKFNELLIKYFEEKGLNVSLHGNDILIDNEYKVSSYSSVNINGRLYTAFHISIGMDIDLIKNICQKEMVKIPKGLSEYGITTEEIVDLVTKLANEIN